MTKVIRIFFIIVLMILSFTIGLKFEEYKLSKIPKEIIEDGVIIEGETVPYDVDENNQSIKTNNNSESTDVYETQEIDEKNEKENILENNIEGNSIDDKNINKEENNSLNTAGEEDALKINEKEIKDNGEPVIFNNKPKVESEPINLDKLENNTEEVKTGVKLEDKK